MSAMEFPALYKDSIAVIGQAVHLAGDATTSAEALFELLKSAKDVSERVPHRRFNADAFGVSEHAADKRGKTDAPFGYFCKNVTGFDTTPGLFGMSPTEVKHVDPQQRELLLLTADAIRNAGMSMGDVFNTNTGVFIGNMNRDYLSLQTDSTMINQYSSQGSAAAIAANRISFTFNFRGCSIAVDSACSATGIGTHMAFNDLLARNLDMAVVGGFNLVLMPYNFVGLSQLQVLSKVGRIQAFDEAADGYTRGEGGGVVLLKRFEDAVRDGNRILAVVATSATCSNGRSVTPMAAPSLDGQLDLLKRTFAWALRRGIAPSDIQYIECHGTGTHRGDSIEVNACGQYFFKDTPVQDRPPSIYIGSVKANVGHLEAAACIPSLVKVIKCLEHKLIPKQINYTTPNKEILPEYLDHLIIPTEHVAWAQPATGRPRMALVNSYGYGGSGAQLLVMEYVQPPMPLAPALMAPLPVAPTASAVSGVAMVQPPAALVVWGHTRQAVLARKELHINAMRRLASEGRITSVHEYCSGASAISNNLAGYHAVAAASSIEAMVERLQSAAVVEVAHRLQPVALVFPGQGSQGDASPYFMRLPAYRTPLAQIENWLVRRRRGFSILTAVAYDRTWPLGMQNLYIFAHEVALGSLLLAACPQLDPTNASSSAHSAPATGAADTTAFLTIVGHSLGEYAASYFTKALSLNQCCDAIWGVGEGVEPLRNTGYMAEISRAAFATITEPQRQALGVDIACFNTPEHYIIGGSNDALQPFAALGAVKIPFVDFPFHSRAIDSAEAAVKAKLQLAGVPVAAWWDNLRGSVDFLGKLAAVTAASTPIARQPKVFIEVSMVASLSTAVVKNTKHDCLCLAQHVVRVLTTLRTAGYRIKWRALTGHIPMLEESLVPLPMHLESHWFESMVSFRVRMGYFVDRPMSSELPTVLNHFVAIRGEQRAEESPAALYEYRFDPSTFPLLGDHIYNKNSLVPGTFWVTVYSAFADTILPASLASWRILNVQFKKACFSPNGTVLTLRLLLHALDEKSFTVQALFLNTANGQFVTCSDAVIEFLPPHHPVKNPSPFEALRHLVNAKTTTATPTPSSSPATVAAGSGGAFYADVLPGRHLGKAGWYDLFVAAHFDFGPRFTLLDAYDVVARGSPVSVFGDGKVKDRTRCTVSLSPQSKSDFGDWPFPIHPGIVDAATQAIAVLSSDATISSSLPFKIGETLLFGSTPADATFVAFAEVLESDAMQELSHVLITALEPDGVTLRPVMLLRNFECKVLELNTVDQSGNNSAYYAMQLPAQELDTTSTLRSDDRMVLALYTEGDAAAGDVAARLAADGDELQVTVLAIGPSTLLTALQAPSPTVKVALIVSGESTHPAGASPAAAAAGDDMAATAFATMGSMLRLFHAAEHLQATAPGLAVAVVTTASVLRPAALAPVAAAQQQQQQEGEALYGPGCDLPVAQSLLGAFRIFNVEHHEARARFIEVVADPQRRLPIARLRDELLVGWAQPKLESHVLVAASTRHVGVFDRCPIQKRLESLEPRLAEIATGGSWLLTGGCGAMGLALAKYLSQDLMATSVVLMSRRGVAARDQPLLNALDPRVVRVLQADVTDYPAFQAAALAIAPPVAHVIHLAMVLNDKFIRTVTPEDIRTVGSPKVQGAWSLHRLEALLPRPYRTFWVMSSTTALVGTGGQYVYGASNAFMDGLVLWRKANGLHGISLQLGPVSGLGFLSREEGQMAKTILERSGWVSHDPAVLMGIFQDVLLRQELMPLVSSPLQLAPNYFVAEHRKWKIYERLITTIAAEEKELGVVTADDALAVVKKILAQELRYAESSISGETSLNNLGVTSMVQNILSLAIQENFSGVSIPQSFFLSPDVTPNAIAKEIVDRAEKLRLAAAGDATGGRKGSIPPGQGEPAAPVAPPALVWFSGSSESAVQLMALGMAKAGPEMTPQAAITDCIARSSKRNPHRLAAVLVDDGKNTGGRAAQLQNPAVAVASSVPATQAVCEILLFPGQGTQFVGMSKPFYDAVPAFRHAFEAVLHYLAAADVASILATASSSSGTSSNFVEKLKLLLLSPAQSQAEFNDTRYAQCGLFVMEFCLARTLLDCGVAPVAAAGHSIGELAAKTIAGELLLADAVKVVVTRAFAMHAHGHGRMAAVQLTEPEVRAFLSADPAAYSAVEIAAINADTNIVISGPEPQVAAAVKGLKDAGRKALLLPMPHAFHTSGMSPAKDQLRQVLSGGSVVLRSSSIPLVSNFTGAWVAGPPDASFYLEQLDHTVQWDQCATLLVAKALALSANGTVPVTFIEVGPGTVLGNLIKKKLPPTVPSDTATGSKPFASIDVMTCCTNSTANPVQAFLHVAQRLWLTNPRASPSPLFSSSAPWSDPTRRIVLTGATSFLGIHLLHAFLTMSGVSLVLPIAGRSDQERLQQLAESLVGFGLPRHDAALRQRVMVCGKDEFDETATEVIHCTTSMNSLVDYEGVKEANVTWATALAQRCIDSGATLHYISTMSVLWGIPNASEATIPSIDKASMARHNGYTQSKIVMEARLRTLGSTKGLKYCIYRVDMLGGGSDSGVLPPNAYFTSFLRSIVKSKAYPVAYTGPTPQITVDDCAAQIMLLAGSTGQFPQVYHLTGGKSLFALSDFATGLKGVSYTEFKKGLGEGDVSEQPLQTLLEKRDMYVQTPVAFRATHEALQLASFSSLSSGATLRTPAELAATCRKWAEAQEV